MCCVCTHHLVWFARHSRGKKLRQKERDREREGERRGGHAKERQLQRAQAEGQHQEGTAYSCASSIRNFTHYAVPTSAWPDRSKATPKQKKKEEEAAVKLKKRWKAEARQTLKVKNYAESQAAATTTAAQPEL